MARTEQTDVLNAFVNLLADAIAARLGSASPARASAVRASAPAARRRRGEKRLPEYLARITGELLAYVKANKGQRIEEISKAIDISTKELALPAKKLIATKKVKTKGQRRATRYYPA